MYYSHAVVDVVIIELLFNYIFEIDFFYKSV